MGMDKIIKGESVTKEEWRLKDWALGQDWPKERDSAKKTDMARLRKKEGKLRQLRLRWRSALGFDHMESAGLPDQSAGPAGQESGEC